MASDQPTRRCTACNGTGETPLVGGGYDPTKPCPVCAGTGSRDRTADEAVARVQAWLADERQAGRLIFGLDDAWVRKLLAVAYPPE